MAKELMELRKNCKAKPLRGQRRGCDEKHDPSCKRVGCRLHGFRLAVGGSCFFRPLDALVLLHARIHGQSITTA